MPSITREVAINAAPEEVFDLIARVEDFAMHSAFIKEVKEVSPRTYRWKVRLLGVPLEWEAAVVEFKRPVRFAWRSRSGVHNAGSYDLKPEGNTTRVTFRMEYSLGGPFEALLAPLLKRIMASVAGELLDSIKKELEA